LHFFKSGAKIRLF